MNGREKNPILLLQYNVFYKRRKFFSFAKSLVTFSSNSALKSPHPHPQEGVSPAPHFLCQRADVSATCVKCVGRLGGCGGSVVSSHVTAEVSIHDHFYAFEGLTF